uniref:C2H2-type domain-containing protein n=1 Tax=Panagrolaimus sp. ES5 TaxID=591445 RepID=A0AC34GTC1_9BILA
MSIVSETNLQGIIAMQWSIPENRLREVVDKPRTCPLCPKTFTHAYALRGHFVRVHLRHKRYVCNVCQAGFWSNSDLERHMPRHTGQRFICDACDRTYTSKQRLTEHFRHPSACWLDPPMLKYIKAVNKVDV